MKISVLSRREMENLVLSADFGEIAARTNFISINNIFRFSDAPVLEPSPIPQKYAAQTLVLRFDDAAANGESSEFLFDANKARQIRDFANLTISQNRDLVVHCAAGVSRSGAVGTVLNDYANRFVSDNPEDFEAFKNSAFYSRLVPNMSIAMALMRELEMI
ncbi:MAG: hypothetical protein J6T16_01535 [Opitutales bacterium]|nr:hypothetical protein [Opitutales bacterium]